MATDETRPLTDYTTMSGAEFKREVGADPEKWAAGFLAAYAEAALMSTRADRVAFVAGWFRDAMEAAVKAAGRQERPSNPEWEENRRRAIVAREHEVARRHSGGLSE